MSKHTLWLLLVVPFLMGNSGCEMENQPTSSSGVAKATVKVQTNAEGYTIEQENIMNRLKEDNKPGSIKHLYIISAYSGQVIIYSTVKGKITSGGKRLTPKTVMYARESMNVKDGVFVEINGNSYITGEVLQDDGTYGDSSEYVYWWDTRGVYHQHFVSGGQILHVSNQPLNVKGIIINMEVKNQN